MPSNTRRRLSDLSVTSGSTPGELAAANSGDTLILLDPSDIDPSSGIEDRFDLGSIDALAESIRESGQDTPIAVRTATEDSEFGYEIVCGRRRLHAIMQINRRAENPLRIRAILVKLSDQDLYLAQVRENMLRRNYSFSEQMRSVAALNDRGISGGSVVAALGIDKGTVSRMERMAASLGPGILQAFGRARKLGRGSFERLEGALLEGLPWGGEAREHELERRRAKVAELVISNTRKYAGDERRLLELALKELKALVPTDQDSDSARESLRQPMLTIAECEGCLRLEFRIGDDPASKELARDEMLKAQGRFHARLARLAVEETSDV